MTKQPDKIVTKIHATRGLTAEIARACGIQRQALHQWTQVPPAQVLTVASLLKMTPEEIRPDIFGPKKRPRKRPRKVI
jgi:DNA-binding transcriptional regulator YdaS (Cro superfamily)